MTERTASILQHPNAKRDRKPAARPLPARIELNMRQLRTLVAVAQGGSVHKAASILHVTQPAATRAIHELEQALGLELFERTPKGMVATPVGAILVERTQRVFAQLAHAEHELAEMGLSRRSSASISVKVTHRHLRTLVAIDQYQTETAAALELDVSQPSVTQTLRELERIVEADLFLRTARGMLVTRAGEVMVRRTKLMFHELQLARDDIAAQSRQHHRSHRGRCIAACEHLAGAARGHATEAGISRTAGDHSRRDLRVVAGRACAAAMSICWSACCAIRFRAATSCRRSCSRICSRSSAARVIRSLRRSRLRLADVINSEWVLPYKGAPSRKAFEQVMHAAGLPLPKNAIESNALVALRALLIESDRLSILSRNQIHYEELHGMLSVLPIDMRGSERPIGITTRADAKRSVGLNALMQHLRAVGDEMKDRAARLAANEELK